MGDELNESPILDYRPATSDGGPSVPSGLSSLFKMFLFLFCTAWVAVLGVLDPWYAYYYGGALILAPWIVFCALVTAFLLWASIMHLVDAINHLRGAPRPQRWWYRIWRRTEL